MTPCSPSHGTTLSRGQIETPITQLNSLRHHLLQSLGRLKRLGSLGIQPFAISLLSFALAGCGPSNYCNHVELVMSSLPTPGTTFELRFDSSMIKSDHVGLVATNSPLVIQPRLAGTFTWLSTRSGVFTPSEPLALNITYQLTLRPDLQLDDSRPCNATLHWIVTTPPFDLNAFSPRRADTNASAVPEVKLVFNADVRAAEAEDMLYFCDRSGHRIAADVRQGTAEDYWSDYEFGSFDSMRTWKQEAASISRFANRAASPVAATEYPTNEVPNLLIASPRRALPIGEGWQLVVSRGITTADHSLKTREQREVPLGNVTAFVVQEIAPYNYLNSGPTVEIDFSKPIPDSLTNNFRDLIELRPTPTNLSARVERSRLTLVGNFQGGTDYTLTLRPGFTAAEPFALQGPNTFSFLVPHVPPRLYFPALSCDQLASGNRSFSLITVNVPHVRIRAKLMDLHTAIHALRGFASYFASPQEFQKDWQEPYRCIDYNLLPGVTVFDREFTNFVSSDIEEKLAFRWDEVLSGRHTGVVFLDARRVDDSGENPALGTQSLIQLTDLGMVWKTSQTGVDVFVFSQSTGQPVPGATVRLFSSENEPLQEAVTDTNGLAHVDLGAPASRRRHLAQFDADTNADWIAVQQGDDFHALPLDENRAEMFHFNLPFADSGEQEDTRRVMLFADRDLYRPGEAMHLEAIVRDWLAAGLSIPRGLTGTVECVDPRGHRFFQTNATFSALASWSTLIPLPAAPCGYYSAKLRLGTNDYSYAFQVQDFKPNAFEIMLPCKDSYPAGERIELPLSARYLFGKSLSHARIDWSLDASDTDFRPDGFQQFSFRRDDFEWRFGRGRSSVSLAGHGVLLGTSNFVIAPELSINPAAPQPRMVSLLAEVTDVNQQTLSHSVQFIRHSSDFYLGLRQVAEVLTNGTNVPLEAVAVGAEGKPWPEAVKAHLTLQRIDWESVRVQGAGKTVRFHNEPVFTNILEKEISIDPVAMPNSADEARGNPITGLPPLLAGEYLLELKSEDHAGRSIASSLDFHVAALAELGWNYRNGVQLTLKPDHESYTPGQTAEILIEAPFSGTALVSIEREKVLRSFVTHLEGNAPSIRFPIEPGDVPNVFVSVTLTRGAENSPNKIKEPEYRIGCCDLPVTNAQNLLDVNITSAQTNYLPGRPVDVTVSVTDSAQHPVSGAELILYAVDDGILGLTAYSLPDPYKFFYEARPLSVQSSISLPNLLTEDPEELRFENKGYLGGGGGMDRVRKNFLACAYWNAALATDSNGQAHAQFTAPDSLTRYRLFAVLHTADNRFGSSQSEFHVTKPLIVEPSLPSIANITDHLVARAVVLNQTKNSGAVLISLELDAIAKSSSSETPLTRQINIPANGSVPVEFPIDFIDTGDAKWVWKAKFIDGIAPDFTDAVQSTIAVGHIAPVMREVLLARTLNSETNLLASANPQLLGGHGTITVNVADTRLNELAESAMALLEYPYGCAEQTGSSLLPWILLRDIPGLLRSHQNQTNEAGAIHAGIDRLLSMQTESGGLGYWPKAKEPMLWASAYGGMVLALAQRHGITVPKEQFDPLLTYLSEQLRSLDGDSTDLSDSCLAVYALALAGRPEPAYHERLFSLRAKLSSEDRALLALAIAESHGPVRMIADLLQTGARSSSGEHGHFGCPTREEAISLLAWISYQPQNSIIDHLVDDLMRDQKDAHWATTQGNAWGLLALTEYARRVEIKRYPAQAQLSYAGQTISFRLDQRTNVFTHTFAFTNSADAALLLSKQSTNCLYTTVSIEARPPETPQPRQDHGFSLQRNYDRLGDDNQLQGAEGLHVGDRVLVTLRLNVHKDAEYVAIDDPLPSILEAINPEFRTQQARSADALAENGNWWVSDFREIRKDRCLSFMDFVPAGRYTFRYVARVRAAGSVTAPSAKVEEMYHPERRGLTETQTLTSHGLE